MEISITHQCQTFLFSLLLGAGLSLLYDCFRFLRLVLPEQSWRIALEDITYCLLCAAFTIYFALEWEQGRLRSYLLLGEILGWILCHFTVGQLLYDAAKKIIAFFESILRWIWRHILRPVAKLLQTFLLFFAGIGKFVGKKYKKVSLRMKFSLKHRGLLLYNLIKSEKRPIFRKR